MTHNMKWSNHVIKGEINDQNYEKCFEEVSVRVATCFLDRII